MICNVIGNNIIFIVFPDLHFLPNIWCNLEICHITDVKCVQMSFYGFSTFMKLR